MSSRSGEFLYGRRLSLAGIDSSGTSEQDLRALFREVLDGKIHGIAFSPYVAGQGPSSHVSEEQIRDRLRIIQAHVQWVRSFSCTNGNENIARIAREYGLNTMVGAWLQGDEVRDEIELANVIELAQAGHADIVAVGNEVLLRDEMSEDELIESINRVKAAVGEVEVGYVDAYFKFVDHPRVTEACDVVLANCYPFWEGCSAEYATLYAKEMYRQARRAGNGKRVIISETGWPTVGTATGAAVPSYGNALRYFLNTYQWAAEEDIAIFYFSSFDEDWKVDDEGDVGACWGLWDKDGRLKYA